MLDEYVVNDLVVLVKLGMITTADILDADYKAEVEKLT